MAAGLKQYDIDPPALDPNGIAESQSVTADNLALNGALCDSGTALQFDIGDSYGADIAGVKLLFDAGSDISTAVFTITGKDEYGNAVTEAVTGVTTTAVSTVGYFSQVTVIAVTVAAATGCFVGTVGGAMVSKTYVLNRYSQSPAAVAVTGLTGTIDWSIQESFDNIAIDGGSSAAWLAPVNSTGAGLTTTATDLAGTLDQNATGARLIVNSYSDGAELQFHVSDSPFR